MQNFTTAVVFPALALLSLAFAAPAARGADAPAESGGRRLFHVVSVKFKPTATPEQIAEVEAAFRDLKNKIPGVVSLSWGTNVSPEKRDKGYTHCFVLTFASDKDRDAYLIHPDHKAFGKLAGPSFEDVMVIDFWDKK